MLWAKAQPYVPSCQNRLIQRTPTYPTAAHAPWGKLEYAKAEPTHEERLELAGDLRHLLQQQDVGLVIVEHQAHTLRTCVLGFKP